MKTSHNCKRMVVLALAALAGVAWAAPSAGTQGFDFDYLVSGADRAKPVQVFDDGKSTFFQFKADAPVPAIMVQEGAQTRVLVPKTDGQYIVVPEVHGRYDLQIGKSKTVVVHAGKPGERPDQPDVKKVKSSGLASDFTGGRVPVGDRLVASLKPSTDGSIDDEMEHNSYATPVKGDRVAWVDSETRSQAYEVWFKAGSRELDKPSRLAIAKLVKGLTGDTKLVLVGRDDDSLYENLDSGRAAVMKAELIKAGYPADRIEVKTGSQGVSKNKLWPSEIQVVTYLPTAVAKHDFKPAATQVAAKSPDKSIEAMLKAGQITPSQAQAMLKVTNAPTAGDETLPSGFTLAKEDMTVHGTVERWSKQLGYRVVWEVPADMDAPVANNGDINASTFKDALQKLVAGLKAKGYLIDVTVYSNHVVRFTGASDKPKT